MAFGLAVFLPLAENVTVSEASSRIFLFEAYKYTTVSGATLSYSFVVCFVMSTLGTVMITSIGDMGGGNNFIGILFGLGAEIFNATVALIPYVLMASGVTLGNLVGIGWTNLLIVGLINTDKRLPFSVIFIH